VNVIDEHIRRAVRGERKVSTPLACDDAFLGNVNIVVRAGAGSGKTTVLVERMVALVRSGTKVRTLAAITFTRKAAGEMRGRFFASLMAANHAITEALDEVRSAGEIECVEALTLELRRVEIALASIEDVFIDTIHAFCAKLLRERPFLAGLGPDFRLIDDREERRLRRRFWNIYLSKTLGEKSEWLEKFDALGFMPEDAFDYFGDRCGFSELVAPHVENKEPDLRDAASRVADYLEEIAKKMPFEEPVDGISRQIFNGRRFVRVHGLESNANRAEFLEGMGALVRSDGSLGEGVVKVMSWSRTRSDPVRIFADALKGKVSDGETIASIADFVMAVVRPALTEWRRFLYAQIEAFVYPAVQDYGDFRVQRGRLTFDDLLRICVHILKESPAARSFFSEKYSRILVDEFQDTDPLQAEALFLLSSSDINERDWRACRPRPGSLFIVGDDKQSIYRFRHADIRVFEESCRLIEACGGHMFTLQSNFRSEFQLCEWNNAALALLFDAEEAPYQASFEKLVSPNSDTSDRPCVLQLITEKVPRDRAILIARIEAAQIAGVIRAAVDGKSVPTRTATTGSETSVSNDAFEIKDSPYSFGDFMILVRYAKRMSVYSSALESAGIPYVMAGGKSLHKTSVLPALIDLIDAAYNTNDQTARIAFLRGPFAGIADDALYHYVQGGGQFSGPFKEPTGLPEPTATAFGDATRTLQLTRDAFTKWPPSQALEYILCERGLLAGAALGTAGSSQAGALFRLLSMIRTWESDGSGWIETRAELEHLLRGEIEAEGMTLETGTGNAVQLLNVHQAKGLEARVVFLADPLPGTNRQEVKAHVDRTGESPILYLPVRKRLAFGSKRLAEPSGWHETLKIEERFDAAEKNRLLYVAATRAKELLIVSRYTGKDDAGVWQPLYRWLNRMPELLHVSGDGDVQRTEGSLGAEQWQERLVQARSRIDRAAEPSYRRRAVSQLSDIGSELHEFSDEWTNGRGRGYGRAIHRLFELAVRRRIIDPEAIEQKKLVERLIKEEIQGSDATREDASQAALEHLASFRRSSIWGELLASESVLTEVPFSVYLETDSGAVLLSGVIDLAYRNGSAWKIVDYKTDGGDEDSLVSSYGDQVRTYSNQWQELTGEPVQECGLWWVPMERWIPLT